MRKEKKKLWIYICKIVLKILKNKLMMHLNTEIKLW